MSAIEFGKFIEKSRKEFKAFLTESVELNDKMRRMLGKMANKCCGSIEEQILADNLREVFTEHMEVINQGA